MNSLKTILVGFIIGGAFGAKIGAYLTILAEDAIIHWSVVEFGFLVGAGFGLAISFIVLLVKNGIFERTESGVGSSKLSTNTI